MLETHRLKTKEEKMHLQKELNILIAEDDFVVSESIQKRLARVHHPILIKINLVMVCLQNLDGI